MSVVVELRAVERGLVREWDELADRTGANPFLRPACVLPWWRGFGRGRLELLVARRGGWMVGMVALQWRRGALASPTNWHTPAFDLLAVDEAASCELARALFSRGAHRVALAFLDAEDAELSRLSGEAEARGYRLVGRTLLRSPYVAIDGDWKAYERRVSTKLLSEVRRRRRRLEEEGGVSLDVHDGTSRLDRLLDEGFAIEGSGWKDTGGTAIRSHRATRVFYRELALAMAERDALRLAFLRLDGRPIAFDYCLEDGGVHYLLKTGYDPAYRKYAPGALLRHGMLARAFSAGLQTYEFLGDPDPWKASWTSTYRERLLVQAFAPSAPGVLAWVGAAHGRPLLKRARAAADGALRSVGLSRPGRRT